jgi:uncharacterized phage protein (TIGR02218 family)
MPKTIPAALQAHYDTGQTALAVGLLIQRKDGELYGITSCSQPLVLDLTPWDTLPWVLTGETAFEFDTRQGLDLKTIESTAGFEVDDSELQTLNDGTLFTEADILAGRWSEARFRIFLYRWDVAVPTIANDVETLKVGSFGQTYPGRTVIRQELRCLKELLQHPVGIVSQPTCRARFGSSGPGQCNKDPASFTFSLTVTGVTSNQVFTASAATQDADYFGNGELLWTGGNNDGLQAQVNEFESGVFTLAAPMVLSVQVGDTFTAIAGCRKRRSEDCRDKFANVLNFQGEPDRPTTDRVVSGQ